MKYTVTYRRSVLKRKIKDVVGDGLIEGQGIRYFIKENGERIEVPTSGTVFWFSYERNEMAKQREKEKFQELQADIKRARQDERLEGDPNRTG